jgi:hypothetical protein
MKEEIKGVYNNTTMRNDLIRCYNELRNGTIGLREANALANVSGKILKSASLQHDYNIAVGNKEGKIDFFEG